MLKDLPQLVPQSVCLECQGCCRFKEKTSSWRPKIAKDEIDAMNSDLAQKIFSSALDDQNYFKTKCTQNSCRCRFLDENNLCGIYQNRPLECQLYPFLLTKNKNKVEVSVHMSCPHIQDIRYKKEFDQYANKLKEFIDQKENLNFIRRNRFLAGDYSNYQDEIDRLFTLNLDEHRLMDEWNARKKLFDQYEQKMVNELSSCTMVNVFSWSEFFKFRFVEKDQHLCIFAEDEIGTFLYLPPVGRKNWNDVIDFCFEQMKTSKIAKIENVGLHQIHQFSKEKYEIQLKGCDYVYLRKDIEELKGNRFKSKRAAFNHFTKNNFYQYESYQDGMLSGCMELYQRWAIERSKNNRDGIYLDMIKENHRVHELMLRHHQEFGLIGRVVMIDEKVKAYTFGFKLSEQTFCILFEIADVTITGLPTFIFKNFCSDKEIQEYSYINVMDDSGMENISQTKLSFNPAARVPSYTVKRKQ